MGVTVWDKACFELFHMTASKLRDLWEDGYQDPSKRADLLDFLTKPSRVLTDAWALHKSGPTADNIRNQCFRSISML